ncbi:MULTISPECIES: hypothetical protein [Bacillus]|uniref:hypothetical protein n=1 Tax=Bacillus TaxID=1386 RepID=UPI0022822A09|nr:MULTISPECIES: hypothetical protein [Bacillus]MCY7930910.1 hypothetical protein [Bacillus inaquosorum]MCY8769735.1 hypothetical protein [Bacillus inaquosorum]MEC1547513.1 hypothetical protein [Bacillus rugosus]
MIDREREFKRTFKCVEKLVKHRLAPSNKRKYNIIYSLDGPEMKLSKYIKSVDEELNFEQRLLHIKRFSVEQYEEEKKGPFMVSDFYPLIISYIDRSTKSINDGNPAIVFNVSR